MSIKVTRVVGDGKVANVYIAETSENKYLEFTESTLPPLLRKDKWVLVVSVLFGCPVGCLMCDAGNIFEGRLSKKEILAQIDYLVDLYYPDRVIDCKEFKIQFARMGDPALNPFLLNALEELPSRYNCEGLLPSISTIAPEGGNGFLSRLSEIKNNLYSGGRFQMQFSIHSTNQEVRDKIIPAKKWDFAKIANYAEKFYVDGDKKIGLNFALAKDVPLCADELKKYFSPDIFIIKITPVNPTISAVSNNLESYFIAGDSSEDEYSLVDRLQDAGYEVIVSIGNHEENKIGSNCGQYIRKFVLNKKKLEEKEVYSYVD